MQKDLPVAIVGGGVSGLALAYRLHQKGRAFVLYEAGPRFGGNIVTAEHDGFLYDLGPDSFLKAKTEAAALCTDLGLADELISPAEGGTSVLVAHDGALHPMPEGLSLGVPKRPGPLMATPLLSGLAKCRAMLEPFVKRPAELPEESILDFTTRRLGPEMAERLAAPLLSGVFAGDASKISMTAAFPQLLGLEKKYGSLFSGMNGGKSPLQVLMQPVKKAPSPFTTLKRGMGSLVEALLLALPEECLHLNQRVLSLSDKDKEGAVTLQLEGQESVKVSDVAVAGPPWAAAALLSEHSEEFAQPLNQVRGFHTATVFFGLDSAKVEHNLEGSGFIVPPGEAEILAATFISSKWDYRAPSGKALVRAFVGGAKKDVSAFSEDELKEVAHRELTRLLGSLGPVSFSRVHRYTRGTPQPEIGHTARLARVNAALAARPWISLIGSGYGGVGIPDCIRQANQVADKLTSPEQSA